MSKEFNKDKHTLFQSRMETCLTQMSRFITALCGSPCSACIKLLLDSEDPIKVATLVRDNEEGLWRYEHDRTVYELQKNTSFSTIWNSDKRWFYSGDLVKESEEGHYLNQNPNWANRHHYKTAAVLPIQSPRLSEEGEDYQGIKGFLCLDSEEVNAFPEKPTVYTLACLADILYITLMHYRKFDPTSYSGNRNDKKKN